MKHQHPELLYFGLEPDRVASFWNWVGLDSPDSLVYTRNARFTPLHSGIFNNSADLLLLLEQFDGDLQSLHVIVDLLSVPQAQVGNIRAAIAGYPEVQFLFDRHPGCGPDWLPGRLFPENELYRDTNSREDSAAVLEEWRNILSEVNVRLLEVDWEQNEEEDDSLVCRIICGMDNTFDASNLRYAVKYRKYLSLKVDHNRNFSKMQDSRRRRLAVCVDEETRQNIELSYAFYANGYRVLPVTTRQELEAINEDGFISGSGIVVRDYDLQFEDEDGESVDEIRGYKYCDEADLTDIVARKGRAASYYSAGWNDFTASFEGRDNRYWKRFGTPDFPVCFVTGGPARSMVSGPGSADRAYVRDGLLVLPGLTPPVCGLYEPFHSIPQVGQTYKDTRYAASSGDYLIETSRKNHDHSTPLDIYEMVNNMILRAENYYKNRKYILSALVAGESIEVMNGFHHRLMLKAYYIKATAENALAMDGMGSNEEQLASDAEFRIAKVREDITRFYGGDEGKGNSNTLTQIYSDCRLFCKEREHFLSEDAYISAMGHLLEGLPLSRLFGLRSGGNKRRTEK